MRGRVVESLSTDAQLHGHGAMHRVQHSTDQHRLATRDGWTEVVLRIVLATARGSLDGEEGRGWTVGRDRADAGCWVGYGAAFEDEDTVPDGLFRFTPCTISKQHRARRRQRPHQSDPRPLGAPRCPAGCTRFRQNRASLDPEVVSVESSCTSTTGPAESAFAHSSCPVSRIAPVTVYAPTPPTSVFHTIPLNTSLPLLPAPVPYQRAPTRFQGCAGASKSGRSRDTDILRSRGLGIETIVLVTVMYIPEIPMKEPLSLLTLRRSIVSPSSRRQPSRRRSRRAGCGRPPIRS
uniref:Uncharacterized protein n=1 Tax=Mycena chlorophos TaxID=658473 RepID=A0ABQ0LMM2_MYCCL|nr:predicted protein [Mycena chlorophos]